MYFIGVTTRQSSINRVFPLWAERLGLGDCELRGWDFPLRDDPRRYRAALAAIKADPGSLGALVTSHKIDIGAACRDLFEEFDPLTAALGEVGSIYKRNGCLHGRAVDPWTSGCALAEILPDGFRWEDRAALILGAGGAGTALAWHLARGGDALNRPARVLVVDRVAARLAHLRALHATWPGAVPLACHEAVSVEVADGLIANLPPGSLVVNATGVGKDTPGSPLSGAAIFPHEGQIWEFNYRGDLRFLDQARAQQKERGLRIADGWGYFLHGWTRVIADVFNCDIPPKSELFAELGKIAAGLR